MRCNPTCFTRFALPLLMVASFTPAFAADRAVKQYSFDLADITAVQLHGAVGSIHVIHTRAKKISVVLEITQKNSHWYSHHIDLDSVELESHVHGKQLELRQDDDDLTIEWTVELPSVDKTSIEFGVGEIKGEFVDTDLRIKLGVGQVDISEPLQSTGDIDLDVGVGDARLHGDVNKSRQDKGFVSKHINSHGDGTYDLRVKLGVGDIDVALSKSAAP